MIDLLVVWLNAMGRLIKAVHDGSNSSVVTIFNAQFNDFTEEPHYRFLWEHLAHFTELSDKLMGKGKAL